MKLNMQLDVTTTKNAVSDNFEAYFSHPFLEGSLIVAAKTQESLDEKLNALITPLEENSPSIETLLKSAARVKDSFIEVKKQFSK